MEVESAEEDFIVVAPQEAGELPQEYCAQDQSRPKLFSTWGFRIPVGKAVGSFLSSFLDSYKSSGGPCIGVTVDPITEIRHDVASPDGKQTPEQDESISDSETKCHLRRKSMKKQRAISVCELDNEYSLQRFRLHSKESSTDDYLILKVKTRSTSSLASLYSPTTENVRSLGDIANHKHSGNNGNVSSSTEDDVVEKDSPAYTQFRKFSEQLPGSNPGSGVLLRKHMNDKKSLSLPSKPEILSMDSFHVVTNSLPVGSSASNNTLPSGPRTTNTLSSRSTLPSTNSTLPSSTVGATIPMTNTSSAVEATPPCTTFGSNGTETNGRMPSEQEIEEIIRCRCDKFVQYTNWVTLLPHLEAYNLLDPDTRDQLMNPYIGDHQKGVYFYLKTLPSQGKSAYTTFYNCLMQEKLHSGHKTLQEYLCPASKN